MVRRCCTMNRSKIDSFVSSKRKSTTNLTVILFLSDEAVSVLHIFCSHFDWIPQSKTRFSCLWYRHGAEFLQMVFAAHLSLKRIQIFVVSHTCANFIQGSKRTLQDAAQCQSYYEVLLACGSVLSCKIPPSKSSPQDLKCHASICLSKSEVLWQHNILISWKKPNWIGVDRNKSLCVSCFWSQRPQNLPTRMRSTLIFCEGMPQLFPTADSHVLKTDRNVAVRCDNVAKENTNAPKKWEVAGYGCK